MSMNIFSCLSLHSLSKLSLVVNIFEKIPKIITMFINGKEFLTVREMADRLEKKTDAVKKLLQNAGLKPLSRDALYPIEAFETIKNAPPPGRPKKPRKKANPQ